MQYLLNSDITLLLLLSGSVTVFLMLVFKETLSMLLLQKQIELPLVQVITYIYD